MEEKKREKELQKQEKIKENDSWRKEQEDYERKKRAIAEDLKRQYE